MEEGIAGGREQKTIPVGEICGVNYLNRHATGYELRVASYGLKGIVE